MICYIIFSIVGNKRKAEVLYMGLALGVYWVYECVRCTLAIHHTNPQSTIVSQMASVGAKTPPSFQKSREVQRYRGTEVHTYYPHQRKIDTCSDWVEDVPFFVHWLHHIHPTIPQLTGQTDKEQATCCYNLLAFRRGYMHSHPIFAYT